MISREKNSAFRSNNRVVLGGAVSRPSKGSQWSVSDIAFIYYIGKRYEKMDNEVQ